MSRLRASPTLFAVPLLIAGAIACSDAPSADAGGLPDDALLYDLRRTEDEARVVLVRLLPGPGEKAVQPDSITLRRGAVLRFVMVGGVPDAIAFDTTNLSPEARRFLRERGLMRGPLLLEAGQTYDVDLRDAPPGRYPFASVRRVGGAGRGVVEIGGRED